MIIRWIPKMTRKKFTILSFTWGLPVTLLGLIIMCVLFIFGCKPKRYKHGICVEVGRNWGGTEFGYVFLCGKGSGENTKDHELGHGVQNCIFGPLDIFLVIASAARFWYMRIIRGNFEGYYDIWLEASATEWGSAQDW